ncbi:MAG: hypothetical protein E3J75_00955 [Dehalococcoidia bacterium]|nr:MAG: hypothetical protein E3J75_00955 [Dehalococcoidia bacterium]
MVKKKVEKPKREVTKRQLSQWQQQKRRRRLILILGISVIAAVSGIMGGGWYINQYQPLHQTVIRVNDAEFDMSYYIKMLELRGKGQPAYLQYLADEVVAVIEQNELIRQGALELGFSVSDKEVDEELKSYDPPLSKDYRDIVRTEILMSKLLDEYFDQQVPMFAEQRHIMIMFLESENQATEVRARLESGEDFSELAGELSLDNLSKNENGDLGWHPSGVLSKILGLSIPEDYAFASEVGILSQPIYDEARTKSVGYWVIKALERDEEAEQTRLQAILLGSEQEAQDVIAQLENGEDFATLAKELSQHNASKENGGDLGWLTPDTMSSAFDEFAFNSELGTLSEPIRDDEAVTKGGYWLVKVLNKADNRQIEDSDRDWLKAKALDEWVSSLWDNPENEVESYLDNEKKAWAIEKAMQAITR